MGLKDEKETISNNLKFLDEIINDFEKRADSLNEERFKILGTLIMEQKRVLTSIGDIDLRLYWMEEKEENKSEHYQNLEILKKELILYHQKLVEYIEKVKHM